MDLSRPAAHGFFCGVLCLGLRLAADAPPEAPADKTIRSLNGKFQAFLDAGRKQTTVFEVRKGAPPVRLWSMPGWFRVAALSDDGDHLVVGFDGNNLLPLDYRKDEAMLRFYERGKLLRTVRLSELIQDYSKLQRTVSHYAWGHYIGFDRNNRFLLDTVEGRRFTFDAGGRQIGDR